MKILVTGGAGFIGSHAVDHYIEAGHEVLVLDNLSTGHRENVYHKAELIVADLCDHDRISDVLERFRPRLVNHHAAQIDIRRSVAEPIFDVNVNVTATVNLLHVNGVKMLLASEQIAPEWNVIMAGTIIAMLPPLVVLILFRRSFTPLCQYD